LSRLQAMNRHLAVTGGLSAALKVHLKMMYPNSVSCDRKVARASVRNGGGTAVEFITCSDHGAAVKIQKWLRAFRVAANWNNNVVRAEVHAQKIDTVEQLNSAITQFGLTAAFESKLLL